MVKIQGLWKTVVFVVLLLAALVYVVFFAAAPSSGVRAADAPSIGISIADPKGAVDNLESFVQGKFWDGVAYPAASYKSYLPRRYPRNNMVGCSQGSEVTLRFNKTPDTISVKYVYLIDASITTDPLSSAVQPSAVSEEYEAVVYKGAFTLPKVGDGESNILLYNVTATFGENYCNYCFAIKIEI